MSKIVDPQAVDIITLADGDTVQVRQRLNAAEQAALGRRVMHFTVDSASGIVSQADVDPFRARLETVAAYLVGWDFRDDEGAPIPYQSELIEHVDAAVIEEIAINLDRLQKARRTDAAKKRVPS